MNSARWGLDGTETVAAHDGEAWLREALAAWKQGTRWCEKQAAACARAGGGAGAASWRWHWRGELVAGDGGCGDSWQLGHGGCGAR